MGLLDMFGGKDDEREKMRENIEQIREKVQSQERGRQPQQGQQRRGEPQRPPRGGDFSQSPAPDEGMAPQQGQQREQQPPEQPPRDREQTPPPQGQGPPPSEQQPPRREETGGRMRQPPAQGGQEQSPAPPQSGPPQEEFEWSNQEQRQEEETGGRKPVDAARSRLEEVESRTEELSVPSAPEVKELDIPNIEKGPLFITVNKFREALQTVSRLEAISQDLDAFASSLEDTLAEDRRMNKDIQQRLELAEENVEYIKGLVSPD